MKTDKPPINFKSIVIWRHAEAHPALVQGEEQDLARVLTPKGKQQAKRMANWLAERLPKDVLVVSSPAMRAFQTAQALKCEVKVVEALKPSANLQEILLILASLEGASQNLLLVGHQPWLWQLVANLTGFTAQEISIKKGAVWWLRLVLDKGLDEASSADARYNIVAVQSPSLLT
jgi:phosphohistidine phosphatase